MNGKVIAILIVCIAVVAAAGCTAIAPSGTGNSAPSPEAAADNSLSIARIPSESKMATGSAGSAPVPVPLASPGIDTKIIKTAYITLEVKDVPGSVDTLKALVASKGGYLSSSSISEGSGNRLAGTVVLRVPQAEFDATLASVKGIGMVKSVSTQGEDVTEEYVDVQAQITSYRNQLVQYNEIMKKAIKVSDVLEIQQQIDSVQTNLDRLEGRLKYLDSRIDMSTITVNLREPEPVGGETGYNIVSTINEGISGFLGMVSFLIILFFTVLPVIILAGIGYGVYRWRKGKEPAKPPAAPVENK